MRTTRDRIRHAVLFEITALMIVAPLGGAVFAVPVGHFGVVAVISSLIAMGWTYLFNLGFDHMLVRTGRPLRKTVPMRILHAVAFEVGLTCLLVPFMALYLGVSLGEALLMDIGLTAFYFGFTVVYNWAYDAVFPVPVDARRP